VGDGRIKKISKNYLRGKRRKASERGGAKKGTGELDRRENLRGPYRVLGKREDKIHIQNIERKQEREKSRSGGLKKNLQNEGKKESGT